MKYLYLRINFYKSLKAEIYPRISVVELEDWDGEKGSYENGAWMCYKSYLNYVKCIDDVYKYEMVINANIDNYKAINDSVQFAFNKVKEYVEKEGKERNLVFNRYQEFLDNGGFPIKKSE